MGHVLGQILVVLAASLVAVTLLARAGIPSIVGYLAAGIAIGPHGAGLVTEQHLIEVMAEIGVVLLLFTIGLKFSLAELKSMQGLVFGAGALQIGGTLAAVTAIGLATGMPTNGAVFLGMLVAMSSTAILLKLLEDRAETQSPHGRIAVGVAIFQDLCVVPAMLAVPLLAGAGGTFGETARNLGVSVGVIAAVIVGGHFLLPHYFHVVARTRSREVFVLATILVVLATAAATGAADLSPALGALIAGVVLAESDYAQQVLSDVVPLRDLLASLFFVSVGMLVDAGDWITEPLTTVGYAACVVALKAGVVWAIARLFGLNARVAILSGLALSQVGEFSFVLAQRGADPGTAILDAATYERFLSVSVLSMAATPFIMMLGPWIVGRHASRPGVQAHEIERKDHAIVVGYGVSGRNVASVLKPLGIPVVVLELNPRTVRAIRAAGGDAEYGDACSENVLEHVGVRTARALVLTALDPVATRQVVANARRLSRDIEIFVRTRYVGEMAELHRLGADAIVPEELESSIALSGLVMRSVGASEETAARAAALLRGDDYELLSDAAKETERTATIARALGAAEVVHVPVPASAAGKTLGELDLRAQTGATVVAVERGTETLPAPGGGFGLQASDVLLVLGSPDSIKAARSVLGH